MEWLRQIYPLRTQDCLTFVPDSKYGAIYMYILDTGERYIGQTGKPLIQRHYGHIRKSTSLIDAKLKKHEYEIRLLHLCPLQEMSEWERYFIEYYDTFKNGLNLTTGGESNYDMDESIKQKLSKIFKGKKQNPEVVRKRAESNKGKLSKPVIQYTMQGDFVAEYPSCTIASQQTHIKSGIGSCAHKKIPYAGGFVWRFKTENYPMHIDTSYIDEFLQHKHERISASIKGRKLSEETKNKISESHKGKIRTEEHRKNLSKALKGKYRGQPVPEKTHRTHSESAKEYWQTVTDEQRKERSEKAKQTRLRNGGYNTIKPKRAILQYTLNDEFVKEWESATDVQKSLGIKSTNIVACCKGKYKQSGGFIWRYKN